VSQIGVLEEMPAGKKGGRRITKQGQQDCDRIAKEIWESKQ
jgi:ribosomal protein S19E (S16A)